MAKGIDKFQEQAIIITEVFENIRDGHMGDDTAKFASTTVSDLVRVKATPIKLDRALKELSRRTGVSIAILRKTHGKMASPAHGGDIGRYYTEHTLKEHYEHGDHLLRSIDKSFWAYSGTHWKRVTDEQVQNRILETIENDPPGEESQAAVLSAALKLMTARQASQEDLLHLTQEPPPVVNCQNGELWIADDGSVELRPHSHESFLTSCLEVEWKPEAKAPIFEKVVGELFDDDQEMIDHITEIIGYALQPRRPYEAWFMFHGSGANGKTKLVETIQRLMGQAAYVSDRIDDIEGRPFKIGSLAGKLLLVDDDVDSDTKLPDGFLKKISGRKEMSGELKFKDQFNFTACCLPVLLANNWPKGKDLSNGTRRRAHIVPFRQRFLTHAQIKEEERLSEKRDGKPSTYKVADPGIFNQIWDDELPGVLVLAVTALQRLLARKGFQEPAACRSARHEWMAASNPLVQFMLDECTVKSDVKQATKDFYEAFCDYCQREGIRWRGSHSMITRELQALDYPVWKSNGVRWVGGVIAPVVESPF